MCFTLKGCPKKISTRSPHGDHLDVCDTPPAASRRGTVQPSPEVRFAGESPEGNAGLNPPAERVAPAAGGGVMKIFHTMMKALWEYN